MSQRWTYERLFQLAEVEQPQERFDLEFKPCNELRWGKTKAREAVLDELSRDISAMANSAGGTIIYGVLETKSGKSKGLDPAAFTSDERKARGQEWLDQVIRSSIFPAPDFRITSVGIDNDPDNGWYYVVQVEQGVTAHQARDLLFWKRHNATRAQMRQYEVADVMNRAKGPVLDLRFQCKFAESQDKRIETKSGVSVTKPIDAVYITPEVSSRNYISAEYGTLGLTVIFPLRIRDRRMFSEKRTGVQVGDYQVLANAVEYRLDWSVHQARGVVYPGTWTDFGIGLLMLDVPPSDPSSHDLYLIKAQLNGPNMPTKVLWYKMSASSEERWSLALVPEDELDTGLVEQFWVTYHHGRKYFELED